MTVTAPLLVSCIRRARKLANGDESPSSDVYWHTREACHGLAHSAGIRWASVVSALSAWWDEPGPVPAELWAEVAHPDVLAKEVLGS